MLKKGNNDAKQEIFTIIHAQQGKRFSLRNKSLAVVLANLA